MGTATVTVTMNEPYVGIFKETFNIISNAAVGGKVSVSLAQTSYLYTGTVITPEVIVTDKNGKLISSKNYSVKYENNKKVGKGTVIVKMKKPYAGDFTLDFEIKARAAVDKVTLSGTSFTYSGNAITPSVTVTDTNGNTISSTYYNVAYSNNRYAGTATVTVKMQKPYDTEDKYELYFDIIDTSVVQAEKVVLERKEYVYTGNKIYPAVTVLDSNGEAIPSNAYSVKYKDNKEVGTATVTVTMAKPYAGIFKETFNIISNAAEVGDVSVSLAQTSYLYTGYKVEPEVIVKDEKGHLISSKYYSVKYNHNKIVGTGSVIVKMNEPYTGKFTINFEIKARAAVDKVTLSGTSFAYTGKVIEPSVTVTDTNGNTISSTYYKVAYSNNKKRGTAKVIVRMSPPYAGSYEVYFEIY